MNPILSVFAALFCIFVVVPLVVAGGLWGLLKLIDYYLPLRDYEGDDADED